MSKEKSYKPGQLVTIEKQLYRICKITKPKVRYLMSSVMMTYLHCKMDNRTTCVINRKIYRQCTLESARENFCLNKLPLDCYLRQL